MVPRIEMSYGDDAGQLVHHQGRKELQKECRWSAIFTSGSNRERDIKSVQDKRREKRDRLLITMKSQLLIAALEQQQHQNTLISKADKGKLECRTLTGSSTSKQCTNLEKGVRITTAELSRVEYGKDDNRMCCCCCHSLETVCLPLSPTIEHTHTRTASKVIIHLPNMQNLYTQTIFLVKMTICESYSLFYSKLPSKWSNSCTKQCYIPLNFEGWPHLMVQQHLAAAR